MNKIKCSICGKSFYVRKYRLKNVKCCSHKCRGKWITKYKSGENSPHYGTKLSEEHKEKIKKAHFGRFRREESSNWKGGKWKMRIGYICVLSREHPFCNKQGYVYEHRLIMEKCIGRYLKPKEVIHHINEKRYDNRVENLMLFPNDIAHRKIRHNSRIKNGKYVKTPSI